MSTMLDQLRELERLIVELGAKMGCPFEEPQDHFRPTPIDLEMDSHGANPADATSAEPRVLDAPIEADRISGAALANGDVVRILASPDLDANSMHQKVEPNLVESKIDYGGLVETMVQAESRVEVARGIDFISSPFKALALASSAIEEDTIGINPCHPLVSKLDDNPQTMKVNSVSLEVPDDYVAFEEIDGLFVDSVDYIEGIPVAFVQSNSLIEIMDSSDCLDFASAHKVLAL